MQAGRRGAALLMAGLWLMLAGPFVLAASQPATPAPAPVASAPPTPPGGPVTCRVGLDILSIHNLNIDNDTFDTDFWIWSVCPRGTSSPLKEVEFMNANATSMRQYTRSEIDGLVWESAEVTGTFRHRWNLTHFPFDRQKLQIALEDSQRDTAELVYQADTTGSAREPDVLPGGWRISGFDLGVAPHVYETTYGDPRDPTGTSTYSRLTVAMTIERTDLTSFLKLTFVVYIAFLISLISYFLSLRSSNLLIARLTITSAALFAVAVNLSTATRALGSEQSLTMVDQIHVAALIAILVDALAALITQTMENRGRPTETIVRFNKHVMIGVVTFFVIANAALIGYAAYVG